TSAETRYLIRQEVTIFQCPVNQQAQVTRSVKVSIGFRVHSFVSMNPHRRYRASSNSRLFGARHFHCQTERLLRLIRNELKAVYARSRNTGTPTKNFDPLRDT